MELISIIPGFKPKNDDRLLAKAEALKPRLVYTSQPNPVSCGINQEPISFEALSERPLRRGDQVFLDFGRHLVGRLTLTLDQTGSHQDAPAFVQVDLAEIAQELDERPEEYSGWLSRSWIQREQLHVDELPSRLTLPRRYAFRYVRLTVLDTSPKYQLLLKEASCTAESAADWSAVKVPELQDDTLRRIYAASLRTLADCSQQVLEDGPKRDRRLWLGDLRLQALTSYVSFKNYALVKRCLYLFAGTRFPDGRMSANVFTDGHPAADDTYLLDYALMALPALNEYLEETGDQEALADLLEPVLEQADYVLTNYLTPERVLAPSCGELGFIDWCDGLDRQAALQGVLICALEDAASLCRRAGNQERQARYRELAVELRQAAVRQFWSDEKGCFVSGGQVSVHSQVWLTLAGAVTGKAAEAALEAAMKESGDQLRMGSPYMHHYYVMALLKAGSREKAEAHLRGYWGGMLAAGADTFWECWDPEHPLSSPYGGIIVNSFCHAWSCTPAYIIHRFLLHS